MKSDQFLKEGFVEDASEVNADHEVQMARADLFHAAEDALSLHKLLRNVSEQQGLEGWVAAKITLASDYLKTVREYIEYELMTAASEQPMLPIAEGSGSKEKQKTPYRDINSAEYRAAADKQKQRMAKDAAAEPGKKLADKIAKKDVSEGSVTKKPQPYNDPDWTKKLSKKQLDALAGPKYKKDKKEQGVAEVSKATLDRYVPKAVDAHGHADFSARQSKDDPTLRSYHKSQKHTAEKRRQGISRALDRMSKQQGVAEGKKADRYHIVAKDGKPASLASYADRDSAVKDRDAKYPGAVVQQVGPRGKVKGVAEGSDEKQSFKVSYHNPKTRQDKVVTIKALNKDEVLDYCANKGYKNVHVEQGVSEDDSAVQSFLSKGGKIQQLPYKKPRKADKTDYGSKHIGGSGDKMKASRTGTAAKTQGNKVAGMSEGSACNHTMEGKSCPMHGLKECPGYKSSIEETTAGSVATVVNPTPKNKAKVGTLFGGTYKQKKTK